MLVAWAYFAPTPSGYLLQHLRATGRRPSCGLTLDSGVATFPLPLTQLKLLDLPGGRFWKLGHELDAIGNLVSGDLPSRVLYDLLLRCAVRDFASGRSASEPINACREPVRSLKMRVWRIGKMNGAHQIRDVMLRLSVRRLLDRIDDDIGSQVPPVIDCIFPERRSC